MHEIYSGYTGISWLFVSHCRFSCLCPSVCALSRFHGFSGKGFEATEISLGALRFSLHCMPFCSKSEGWQKTCNARMEPKKSRLVVICDLQSNSCIAVVERHGDLRPASRSQGCIKRCVIVLNRSETSGILVSRKVSDDPLSSPWKAIPDYRSWYIIPDTFILSFEDIFGYFWIFDCPWFFLSERHGHVQWRFLWCAIPKLYDSWPFKRQHRPLQQWAHQMLNQATNLLPAQQWKVIWKS